MRIVSLDTATNGCWWYRTKIPFYNLQKRGHKFHQMVGRGEPLNVANFDLLSLARGYEGNVMEVAMPFKMSGRKIVFDVDDGMDLVPRFNTSYGGVMKCLPSYFTFLRFADLVTCTSQNLKDHLRKYTDVPIAVLPNCIDEDLWQKYTHQKGERPANAKLRIGFSGSNSHIEDVIPVLDAIIEVQKHYDFEFYFFGFGANDDAVLWVNKMREMLAANPQHPLYGLVDQFAKRWFKIKNGNFIGIAPVELYYQRLQDLNFDIGICPLAPSSFNRLKSCLKYYEYSKVGALTLASQVEPFSDELDVSFMCEHTKDDWVNLLSHYIEKFNSDRESFNADVKSQQEWVKENRNAEVWAKAREDVYGNLINS